MSKTPSTAATRLLRQHGVAYTEHPYRYEEHGGTSPFGTRKAMPVYVERTILDLERIYVNGGSRGFLVGLAPRDLARVLAPTPVDAAIEK